jgi:hypothetical protein
MRRGGEEPGATEAETYVVKKVDLDYFIEE